MPQKKKCTFFHSLFLAPELNGAVALELGASAVLLA